MAHEAGVLHPVQQHVGHGQHVGQGLFLDRAQAALHGRFVLGSFDIAVAHVAHGTGQESTRTASGVEQGLAGLRIDHLGHKLGHGTRRVVFARIARVLQVIEDLLVDLAKMLAVCQRIEIDLIDLVDDLAQQLAGFHVVVGTLEH